MKTRFRPHQNSGFSLVAVLLIMGVILMAILLISRSRVQQQAVAAKVRNTTSYSDVNQALMNSVTKVLHDSITNASCPLPATMFPSSGGGKKTLDGNFGYGLVQTVVRPPLAGSPPPPPEFDKAVGRCRDNLYTPPSNGTNPYYFCVKLDKATSATSNDTILNARIAFAEFSVAMIDLQSKDKLSCADYHTRKNIKPDGSAGLSVAMVLYWETNAGKGAVKSNFSHKAVSFIANQNPVNP